MLRRLTQRAGFALLEARPVRPVPLASESRRWLTCVARLPQGLAEHVAATVGQWPGAEHHHVYPMSTLHVTLLNINAVDGDDDAVQQVAELLGRTRPIPLLVKGIGVTSHSVFIRAYDADGRLAAVRRSLIDVTGSSPDWPHRRLSFVNVLRFGSTDAAQVIAAARATRLAPAELVLDRAETVRTDRLFSPAATTLLRDVPFTGSR